jgi:hypothetical protein
MDNCQTKDATPDRGISGAASQLALVLGFWLQGDHSVSPRYSLLTNEE